MSVFIDGRVNYELMASYWPHADEDPSASAQEREFARIWRDMPKLVYSRTLQHAEWNATIVREVVPDDIQRLKQQPGGDMVVGGANLAATFARRADRRIPHLLAAGGARRGPPAVPTVRE